MNTEKRSPGKTLPIMLAAAVAIVLGYGGYAIASGTNVQQTSAQKEVAQTTAPQVQWCDDCGQTGHDDDNCPNEWCDECNTKGHDDDACTAVVSKSMGNDPASKDATTSAKTESTSAISGAPAVKEQWCDDCQTSAHDDDNCPNEWCDECNTKGHDDDVCTAKTERCDECGKNGHDDDVCPNAVCDDCGATGHDDCD